MAGDITTIARPYAEAAFSRACESGQVDTWGDTLATLSAITSDPDMAEQIGNPNVPRERLRDAILEIGGDGLSSESRNLVSLLATNNRLSTLPEITRLFEELQTQHQGVRKVHVSTAFEMKAAARKKLAGALEKRLGAEVEMTVETDPTLIGGVQIRAGDLVIDGSVRGKLHKLATELQF
ncbi:MAG: F0F1 ATP synthase subunit delta [Chromatiaceae bacterium]|nr:F0F1 ATP synthase subunit delta [Chromatiaceae bacterium]